MSDMWTFSSCSPLPIMHHSSVPQSVHNHGNHHHVQVSSPQLLPSCLNQGLGLENPDWSQSKVPSQFPSMLGGYSYCDQNQDPAHLDLHLQTQNQFGSGLSCDPLQSEVFCFPDPQCLLSAGPDVDPWGALEPDLSQMESSSLGSGGVDPSRWRSVDFSSALTDDFSSSFSEFYPSGYHDDSAPQPFCSPSTPGPSPHYPQTPFVSSPGPQIRLGFHTQDTTLTCSIKEYDSFTATSDPDPRHLLLSQTEPIQDQDRDQTGRAAPGLQLSAGLKWSDGDLDWTWRKQTHDGNSGTKAPKSRLSCSVCKRDFQSLPALNGHMRSHSGCRSASWMNKNQDSSPPVRAPVPVVMSVSVPVRSRKAGRSVQRRQSRVVPVGGAVLYSSLMHRLVSEDEGDGVGHYTPPPMLSPLRAGLGLYWSVSTTTRGQQKPLRAVKTQRPARTQRTQRTPRTPLHNGFRHPVATETAPPPSGTLISGINTPHINIGRDFQAEIPPLLEPKYVHSDSHNALLLWRPWEELECPVNQQRVEALLMLSRSSVVPGGGASPDYILQLLSETRGDFLLTLEKLLSTPETGTNHTAGGGGLWSPAETRSLVKSLQLHHKDFNSVQRDVQTKSLSQCVEFYYLWKKKLSLSSRTRAGLTVTMPNANGQRS